MKKAMITLCLLVGSPALAQDVISPRLLDAQDAGDYDTILFEETYDLGPGRAQTGFFQVENAPVQTQRIVVLQNGEDCNIYALDVLYRSDEESGIRRARQVGNAAYYVIPSGKITELNLYFEQVGPRAVCDIRIAAMQPPALDL